MNSPHLMFHFQECKLVRHVLNSFLICLILSFITACNYDQNKSNKTNIKPPSYEQAVTKEKKRDISEPASSQEGISVKKITINNKDKAKEIISTSYKKNILFKETNLTTDERLNRLEKAVQEIADKLIKIEPTIKRLSEIDNDLSTLTNQLEILISLDQEKSFSFPKQEEFMNVKLNRPLERNEDSIINEAEGLNEILPASGRSNLFIHTVGMEKSTDKMRIYFDTTQKVDSNIEIKNSYAFMLNFENNVNFSNIKIEKNAEIVRDIKINSEKNSILFNLSKEIGVIEKNNDTLQPSDNYYRHYIDLHQ